MKTSTRAPMILQNRDHERARIKQISLKWARISREKAREDLSTQNGPRDNVSAMSGP
jgi:hypothetical protein